MARHSTSGSVKRGSKRVAATVTASCIDHVSYRICSILAITKLLALSERRRENQDRALAGVPKTIRFSFTYERA